MHASIREATLRPNIRHSRNRQLISSTATGIGAAATNESWSARKPEQNFRPFPVQHEKVLAFAQTPNGRSGALLIQAWRANFTSQRQRVLRSNCHQLMGKMPHPTINIDTTSSNTGDLFYDYIYPPFQFTFFFLQTSSFRHWRGLRNISISPTRNNTRYPFATKYSASL